MTTARLLAGVLLVGLGVSACTSSGGAAPSAAVSDARAGEMSHRCLTVPGPVLSQIAVGAKPGATFQPVAGAAIEAHKGAYVVAVRFTSGGQKPEVGVWTVSALTGVAAPMLVADDVSSTYTTWSSVEEFPQFGVALTSPLIAAVRDCVAR